MKLNKAVAKKFGYELIKSKKSPSLQSHMMNLISHFHIDLVIDVGANCGQFGRRLRNSGYSGDIYSFEPITSIYEKLVDLSENDDAWHTFKTALSDSAGQQEINISESSTLSSFLEPSKFGKEAFEKITAVQKETVDLVTLDSFLEKNIPDFEKRRTFLKMDTQGYDLKVFAGAKKSLANITCMMSELSMVPIYSGMPHYLDALRIFEDAGFGISGVYPITKNSDFSLIEMDCVLVNRLRTL